MTKHLRVALRLALDAYLDLSPAQQRIVRNTHHDLRRVHHSARRPTLRALARAGIIEDADDRRLTPWGEMVYESQELDRLKRGRAHGS